MRIRDRVMLPVICVLIIAFASISVVSGFYTKTTLNKIIDSQMDDTLDMINSQLVLVEKVLEISLQELDKKNLALARSLSRIIQENPRVLEPGQMSAMAKMLGVDEVCVSDAKGVIHWGNEPSYFGLDFHTTEQTRPFLPILDNPSFELAQKPTPRGADGAMFQYVGVSRYDGPGIVQVGISIQTLSEIRDSMSIQHALQNMKIGLTGGVFIVGPGRKVFADSMLALIGTDVSGESWSAAVPGAEAGPFHFSYNGEPAYGTRKKSGENLIVAYITQAEFEEYTSAPILIAFIFGLGGALALAILCYSMLTREVIRPLENLSANMAALQSGSRLDIARYSKSEEFTLLCDAINKMLERLTLSDESIRVLRNAEDVLHQRLKQQEAMSELSQSFISAEEIDTLVNNALRVAGEFLGVTRVLVAVVNPDTGESNPRYLWRGSGETDFAASPALDGLYNSSFPKVQPEEGAVPLLFCDNIYSDKKFEVMETAGVKSFIFAPLYVKGRFWAVLTIEECFTPRAWTESDGQLVSLMSSVIAGAVSRDFIEKEREAALLTARRASQAKSDFLSNMSHEIRTPMNAIIGMTAIAKTSPEPAKKDYCLAKIGDASTHLLGVINDILDMSKIEANKLELSQTVFNFEKMLQKVVNVINFRVEEKKQSFAVHIDDRIPGTMMGDDQRLSQVITNLLSNAIKFTQEEGSIRLSAKLAKIEGDECEIEIEVADTGIGISKEQQARLFTSFQQAESGTSRKFGGTGLGLAISRRIVDMMNGKIWVQSEPGAGSSFFFTARLRVSETQTCLLKPGTDWKSLRILLVDDEPDIREYFSRIVRGFGVACCDTASGGEEACRLLEENEAYDICFVDWKMPGMNGIELSRRIKTRKKDKSVVIMISATEWTVLEKEAKRAGVDKFLPKPLFPSSIVDCINECMGTQAMTGKEEAVNEADYFEGRRVLLAEDVEINREIVIALLEPTSLAIDCAENGKEALRMFRENPASYDMIFMDVQMPEMDGYEATRSIRALDIPRAKTIPIIAMTANVFREDIEKCLFAGMDGHVGKPLNFDEVLTKLRRYLKKK